MSQAIEFLVRWFGASEAPTYLCSLANEKNDPDEPNERRIATRNPKDVEAFVAKWDRPNRGLFFCPSTIRQGSNRTKENVAEVCGLWADVDFKDVVDDQTSILKRVHALPKPPSLIVSSGNGLHLYWRFKEAFNVSELHGVDIDENVERIEAALKLLADLVGADTKVTHVAALMRLPGTHNSKRGEWKDVQIIHCTDSVYELDDLEQMLSETSPIVLRKIRPSVTAGQVNPFDEAAIAASLGFKPPLDVEKRLSGMIYMGGGDAAIHDTQVSVTASLLNAGVAIDEVVKTVLEATRAASGDYGKRWNWKREEYAIRKMCETWLKKHPNEAPKSKAVNSAIAGAGAGSATVHNLDAARVKKEKPKATTVVDKSNLHIMIGATLLERLKLENKPVLIVQDKLWRYQGGMWREATSKHALDTEIETSIRSFKHTSTIKLVAEVRSWVFRNPDIYHDDIEWDDHGKIAVRGGLIDPLTGELIPALPEHHVTARIECEYDPQAACPIWLEMLDSTFSDRDEKTLIETVNLIQEVLGCAMIETKSKALSRALIFHGISNTGKTDLIKVFSGLLTDRPISTPLSALDSTHGLMEFNRNAPWVLHEAFDSQKWHFSATVKSILSGDPVQINIKNGALITKRIRQAVIWGTNVPPQFKEATRAIINRMIVISCYNVFDPKNPIGVALKAHKAGFTEPSEMILAREKSGLLTWALAGLRRALERGHFDTTKEMDDTLESVRLDSNIVAGFLEECASYSPNFMVSTSDFCAAFSVWWAETKGDDRHVPSNDSIGRAMVSYGEPRIGCDSKKLRDNKHRYYAGLHLNPIGMAYWSGASMEGLAKGKTARTSNNAADVNRYIPAQWEGFSVLEKIKKATVTDRGDTHGDTSETDRSVTDTSPKF